MAFDAAYGSVAAEKLEARIFVVLEIKRLPGETHGAVAGVTGFRQLPQVDVSVAGCAKSFKRFVSDRLGRAGGKSRLFQPMALAAIDRHMLSGKRITSIVMVTSPAFEAVHYVTGGAILLELPPVRVVSMAIRTKGEGNTLETFIRMALRTGQGPMHAA